MALSFVGSGTFTHAATSAQTYNFSSLLNAAGATPTLQQGDLVIVNYVSSTANVNRSNADMTPSGYTAFTATDLYQNDSNDVNQLVTYKFMGSTPDTSVSIPASNATTAGVAVTITVIRGVDTVNVLSGSAATSGAANTGVANATAVTPAHSGAWILAFAGAGVAAGAVFTNPAGMDATTNYFRSATITTTTTDANAGVAIYTGWTSGAYDPAAFGGSTSTNTGSWSTTTLALRPAQTQTLTPSLYSNSTTLYAPALVYNQTLTPDLFTNTSTFYAPTVSSPLADDFDDNSRDTAKWNTGRLNGTYGSAGGTVSEANQRVEVTVAANTAETTGYVSANTYSMADNAIYVQVELSAGSTMPFSQQAYLSFGADTSNCYIVLLDQGSIYLQKWVGGSFANVANFSYDPNTHKWWRLRHDSAGDTINIDTASSTAADPPTSGEWTNRISAARDTGLSTSGVILAFGSGAYDSSTGSPITVYFDGFNTGTASATGGQTLSPALFTNTATFYAPTITTGAVTLAPALYTATNTFYAPTVGRGAVTLSPALYSNAQTFYAPTVTPGTATLSPALLTNSAAFYSATVSTGSVTLTPSLFTNASTIYAPSVSVGAQVLTPSLLTNSATFYSPTVATGAVSLTPALFTNAATFYAPTVNRGAVTVSPALFTNSAVFYSPIVANVSGGGQTLTPALFTNTPTFYAATVNAGAVTIAPPLFSNASTIYSPAVSRGTVSLAPSILTNASTFFAATVSPGTASLLPALVANDNTFFPATVSAVTAQTLSPARLDNVAVFFAPTVAFVPRRPTVARPGLPMPNRASVIAPTRPTDTQQPRRADTPSRRIQSTAGRR